MLYAVYFHRTAEYMRCAGIVRLNPESVAAGGREARPLLWAAGVSREQGWMNFHRLQPGCSDAELAAAADANFVAHVSWVQSRADGMRVIDEPGLLLVDSGLACDTFNFVCRARLSHENARQRAREAVDYFAKVGRPFSWWVGPTDQPAELGDYLVEVGLNGDETELAMCADLGRLQSDDPVADTVEIRQARTASELRAFAEINASMWTPPDGDVVRFYQQAESILSTDDSALRFYVGYLDDRPIATAELTVAGGVAGLYNIAVVAPYRHRGIGTAMTCRPLLDARDEGYGVAILQAAAEGVGVYSRVGFRTFGQITEYKPA